MQTITIPESASPLMVAGMVSQPVLFVLANDKALELAAQSLKFFAPEIELTDFPAWDTLPYDRASPNPAIISRRVAALCKLAKNTPQKNHVILTTANALLQKIPHPKVFLESSLFIEKNKKFPREEIINFLLKNGYCRVSKVMESGEFAVRGSIIDIFPSGAEQGTRLDFFGDEVETIKTFDILSQTSTGALENFTLLPASEIVLGENSTEKFRANYRKEFGAVTKSDPLYEAVSSGAKYSGQENFLPLFYDELATILDFLPAQTLLVYGHLVEELLAERQELITDYFDARKTNSPDYKPLPPEKLYMTKSDFFAHNKVVFSSLAQENSAPTEFKKLRGSWKISDENFFEHFKNPAKKIFISCFSQGSLEHLLTLFKNHNIAASQINSFTNHQSLATIHLFILPLEEGFEAPNYTIISEQDIFGDRFIRTVKRKKKAENFLSEAASLSAGELVVHEEHGIGRFTGLHTLEILGKKHDMIKLVYADDGKLYVPVENIDIISRYGAEDENARLDKLGGLAWQERKSKLKERIKLAADELLRVAAERELKTAATLTPDDAMYEEFIARFPYNETEDQLNAISDVFFDLAKGRPMDRLICGDVGFGKTEVALRAAFVAVSAGTQVALICPTTLLARQHFKTFSERFKGFPVTVRQLSRMVTNADAKKIKTDLAEGKTDIVIGTHALLSDDIKFKNLGLVIIDEEQHFGVGQKEKLKKLKAEVHVLTLSATPIPRSLQLAISGVRDLSIIATPPVDRLAVRTFVMPLDELTIREAILREKNRAGQVFYVAPRLADLPEICTMLNKLVPEAKLSTAHGKLTPTQLDDIMNEFYDGKFDVLVSTAIVESGLDISTANTMIIHRADMFGLSQLYQLRGRVGRGKTRGYAYFTLPKQRILTDNAYKRLEVISGLDTLGAGFTIASYDMDIRGFGNLLGDEQSGHVREVGVELYQKMLQEAVLRARAEQSSISNQQSTFSPTINIGASILIPDTYVPELDLRMALYKRAAALETEPDIFAFLAEITDRFGKPPEEVQHLLEVIKLKNLCRLAGVVKMDIGSKAIVAQLHETANINPQKLINFVGAHKDTIKLRPDNKLLFTKPETSEFLENINAAEQTISQILTLQ